MTITEQTEQHVPIFLYHDNERDGEAMAAAVQAAVRDEADRLGLRVTVEATYASAREATASEWAGGNIDIRIRGYVSQHEAADANLMHLEAAAVAAIHSVDGRAEVDQIG